MAWWDKYPYTDYSSLNVDYWVKKFKEITDEWASLYNELKEWKTSTTEELEAWRQNVETSMQEWENALRSDWDDWKEQTEEDISEWETETLNNLNTWKTSFEELFNTTFSNLAQIKTDAEAARDRAETAATTATTAAQSISDSAAQIEANKNEITNLKNTITDEIQTTIITDCSERTLNGITYTKINDTDIKAYGTTSASGERRHVFLNGIFSGKTSTGAFEQVLPAGVYQIKYTASGYTDDIVFNATYSTFSGGNILNLVNGEEYAFTAPVMIGLFVPTHKDFGSIDNPTIIHFEATALTAKDDVARDEISVINDRITNEIPIRTASFCAWETGVYINSDGTIAHPNYSATSEYIPLKDGDYICNLTPSQDDDQKNLNVYIATYLNNTFVNRISLAFGEWLKCDGSFDSIRIVCTYPSAAETKMTTTVLARYFRLRYKGNIAYGDSQKPIYVAIGASTTVGAIHHYTGTPVSYSTYAFPNYVGEILGLETYNLGEGSTGFMARNAGKQPNFMDVIYNNADILSRADLITLIFGYGNDQSVGLPRGEWDDYYPYDEQGYFYIEGDTAQNDANMQSMILDGATLLGCLNWCIKWIGEHYPKAMLLPICGWPSGNDENHEIHVEGRKIITYTPDDTWKIITDKLRSIYQIPIIHLQSEGLPFSYYSTFATDEEGKYAVFSTTGTLAEPIWNSHPNDSGYLMYARYLAGIISQYFHH